MINFRILIYNTLKYKIDPQEPIPLKASENRNWKESNVMSKYQMHAKIPKVGLMQIGHLKYV